MAEYRDSSHFMEIVDMDLFNTIHDMYGDGVIDTINHALQLRIVQDTGVDAKRDFKVNVTDLNTNKNNLKYKQFTNTGDGGITFQVDVLIKKTETWGYGVESNADYIKNGKISPNRAKKTVWLNNWYKQMRPLYLVSDAIDVPNGVYLITKIDKMKQTRKEYTVWTLEFSSFNPLNLYVWSASQSIITALTPKTTTNSNSSVKSLKDCTANGIVYSQSKNSTLCNKYMQEKLYQLGFLTKDNIDSWYGPVTMEAVKKFQRWYNKKGHNLLVDGVCGPVTLKALVNS